MTRLAIHGLIWLIASAVSLSAMEPLEGSFVAGKACAAYHSKNKRSNPGSVSLVPGKAYELRGTNAPARDWVQITVPGAPVSTARWVPVSCGARADTAGTVSTKPAVSQRGNPDTPPEAADLVLALSWQPAFCETRPNLRECRALNAGRLPQAAAQLSLHGLWPQPRSAVYCGVDAATVALDEAGRWRDLPAPDLDRDTRARLKIAMPGMASDLDRHEWIKHGTCFFGDRGGDEYFDDSLALIEVINGSGASRLLAERQGQWIDAEEIRRAFDNDFGRGAGRRVQLDCLQDRSRRLVSQIKIRLKGEITENPDLSALIRSAPPMPGGCKGGIVDPAGLQ